MKANNAGLDQLKKVRKDFDLSTKHFYVIDSSSSQLPSYKLTHP